MRSRQEVRAFLEAQVGKKLINKPNRDLDGQCVTLIKVLMEYLGVSNPYGARGNAKDCGDTYIREGIGTSGGGWLTICVNRNMGGSYGHIWIDLQGEANYESNGAKALITTKNTRPISQAQQFVNFDKWITKEDTMKTDLTPAQWRSFISQVYVGFRGKAPSTSEIEFHMANSNPLSFVNGFNEGYLWKTQNTTIAELREQISVMEKQIAEKPTTPSKPSGDLGELTGIVNEIRSKLNEVFK